MTDHTLGQFIRKHRERMLPQDVGLPVFGRRRTPGLRREEVAQRANISPTWYTWLEQGRGGAPSSDVLNRIAVGLMLTEHEREHLFLLGLGRLPEVKYRPVDGVTPRLQRVLDVMTFSPAIIKNATWDVVGWNRAAAVVLTDYSKLEPQQRNVLRLIFADSRVRAAQEDWWTVARFVVAGFRADAARAGASNDDIARLVDELSRLSPEFVTLWGENDIVAHGEGMKRLHHAELGLLELEFSTFAVDGRPELAMIVYHPVVDADADRIRALIASRED